MGELLTAPRILLQKGQVIKAKVKPVLEPITEDEPPIVQWTISSPLLIFLVASSVRSFPQCGQIILFIFQYLLTPNYTTEKMRSFLTSRVIMLSYPPPLPAGYKIPFSPPLSKGDT